MLHSLRVILTIIIYGWTFYCAMGSADARTPARRRNMFLSAVVGMVVLSFVSPDHW